MAHEVITEQEACSIPEIQELYCLTEQDIEDCTIPDLFDCDPDYFNWCVPNKMPLVKVPVVEVLDKYIIVPDNNMIEHLSDFELEDGLSDKCKQMLIIWYGENFKSKFIEVESKWDNFNKLSYGIAFRGGSGYTYGIWKYIANKKS